MVRVISPETAANLRYRGQFDFAKLAPQRLADGRYAIDEGTATDRRFALQRPLILTGSVEDAASLTFAGSEQIRLTIDGKVCYLSAANTAHAFAIPAPNLYRFECRVNESGFGGDAANGNRRVELVSGDPGPRYSAGQTLWCSFSFVVGPEKGGLDDSLPLDVIHQWHSVDVGVSRAPILGVSLSAGKLVVYTRSDATDTSAVHYLEPRPVDGVVHHLVISGALGESGHLNVWLDGVQIVNTDTPIGYYNDDGGARALAYPHWGMYQNNIGDPLVLFIANIEWGTASLAGRVASPLPVPVPAGGWV